ncbi:MAG: type II toxin-antitoxin system RelE/ParE family toxin [Gammaproteobacteria bacterium]|nr:type II toxin-antitoxin system RelE/ParE family toxin [Gammaproteobacteria bacterium]MDE0283954.1 type II toxin-antitoxin system RelE/ParE family toxin [Gammaproteobacteria bacterium]
MPRILKQSLAEQDLIEIWLYTLNEWGEYQADKYLDDLEEAIRLLAEQPLICRERTELNPPVRIHHHAHHLIVYLALEDGINVVRVLHESMDVDSHME